MTPSGLDFGASGSCCSSPPLLYLQPSGDCFAIFGGRFLKLPGARFSRPRPLPLQPSGEHIRLLLARYSKPHSRSPPYRASRAKRGMEHIHESHRAKHEHVILFGLHPLCAKRIIPGMSPALSSSTKRDQDLLAKRSEPRSLVIIIIITIIIYCNFNVKR